MESWQPCWALLFGVVGVALMRAGVAYARRLRRGSATLLAKRAERLRHLPDPGRSPFFAGETSTLIPQRADDAGFAGVSRCVARRCPDRSSACRGGRNRADHAAATPVTPATSLRPDHQKAVGCDCSSARRGSGAWSQPARQQPSLRRASDAGPAQSCHRAGRACPAQRSAQ